MDGTRQEEEEEREQLPRIAPRPLPLPSPRSAGWPAHLGLNGPAGDLSETDSATNSCRRSFRRCPFISRHGRSAMPRAAQPRRPRNSSGRRRMARKRGGRDVRKASSGGRRVRWK
ncbi:hypothetical protein BHM03_00049780 [Ensete ventricosum]|nr:hypothetical protein BHM03_00049780 [Ensete ventricosum]